MDISNPINKKVDFFIFYAIFTPISEIRIINKENL